MVLVLLWWWGTTGGLTAIPNIRTTGSLTETGDRGGGVWALSGASSHSAARVHTGPPGRHLEANRTNRWGECSTGP